MKKEITKKDLLTLIELLPEQSHNEAASYLIYLILKESEPDGFTKGMIDFVQGNFSSFSSLEELRNYVHQGK
ncbi:MAG: hypothetical protein AB2L14_12185 [Candidatus Xenobiia bacterium LiM19]